MGSIYTRKQKLPDGSYRELPTLWIKYYQGGRAIRESTGTTKDTVARRILRSREGDVEKGIPVNPKMGRITFEDASKDLLNDYKVNKKKSHDHVKRRIDLALEPAFRGKRMLQITTDVVRQYIADRQLAGGAANATINRELAALKRMFTLAIQAGQLHGKPYIPMLREDNTRRGFFEAEQFASVRDHLPEHLRPVVAFAYLTGWRVRAEVLGLEWRQVDWEARVVRLDPGTTKNREGRNFPFTAALEALLKEQKADHDKRRKANKIVRLVFHRDGQRIRNFRRAWVSACKAAGIPGRLVHDFRRTAVRNLERAGVPRSSAMAMVGHKTESIYRRYAIVDAGALRDAAAKLDVAMGTMLGTTTEHAAAANSQTA
jgi:integrase